MKKFLKRWFGMILSGVLLFLAIIVALIFSAGKFSPWIIWIGKFVQELFCFFAILIGIIWVMRQSCFEHKGLMQKLRLMTGCILLFWVLMTIISSSYEAAVFYDASTFGKDIFWLALQISMVALICLNMLCILKSLVYVQPGRGTFRNYLIMIILIFVTSLSPTLYFVSTGREVEELIRSFLFGGGLLHNVFEFCFCFFVIVVGVRCKWIHYLNKKQKLASTGLGIVLLFVLFYINSHFPVASIHYSIFLCLFIKYSLVVFIIYGCMSVLGLMLQLPSAGLMDRRMKDIRSLQQLSTTIGTIYDRQELLKKASQHVLEILNGNFTWIELKKDKEYSLAAILGIQPFQIGHIQSGINLLRQFVEEKNEVILIHDIFRHRFFKHIPRLPFFGGTMLAALLKFKHQIIGIMYVGKWEVFGFVEESRGLFRAFCDQVAVSLENARLVEVSIEREVYKEELRVAHQAQMRLLPQKNPQFTDLIVDGFCLTANDIGGDFYDYVEVSDHRLDIVIGDVSGKGAAAAFYMAELKGVIQSLASHFKSPKALLIQINNFLRTHMENDMFVTMIYMMFDLHNKQVSFSRAGHEPLGYIHHNKIKWIEKRGLGLGLVEEAQFVDILEEDLIKLFPGDGLFLYTDGLIEGRNEHDEEYGQERLTDLLQRMIKHRAQDINMTIKKEIQDFCKNASQVDDITAVMIQYL